MTEQQDPSQQGELSQCPVARGEVDLAAYATKDGAWRKLGIASPARRSLVDAGILTIDDLGTVDVAALSQLHGMGPKALAVLESVRSTGPTH